MTDHLYFLHALLRSFDSPEHAEVLYQAFGVIQRLGRRPGYEQGLAQFNAFMKEVARQVSLDEPGFLDEIAVVLDMAVVGLATDAFEGDDVAKELLFNLIAARPAWREKYERIRADLERADEGQAPVELAVFRDEVRIQSLSFNRAGVTRTVANVIPGRYALKMPTGRVIWEEYLGNEDLEWTTAFPGRALDLAAAETEIPEGAPTREFRLLDGEITLRVFPGLDAGVMKVTINE